jgi:hypothetical protein
LYRRSKGTVEEIFLVMRQAGLGRYADRTRALVAILWRATAGSTVPRGVLGFTDYRGATAPALARRGQAVGFSVSA